MARRRSNSRNSGLGCCAGLFEIIFWGLLLLFISNNPTKRKVGLGIWFVLAIMIGIAGSGGSSGAAAAIIFFIVAVVVVIKAICLIVGKWKGKATVNTAAAQKAEKDVVVRKSFDESFDEMELQAKRILGKSFQKTDVGNE